MKTYVQGFAFRSAAGHEARRLRDARRARPRRRFRARRCSPTDADGKPIPGPPVTIEDLPASERFFAGGDTHDPRLRARQRRRAEHDQRQRVSDRRQRRAAPQRRAALPGVAEFGAVAVRRRRQRVPPRDRVRSRRAARRRRLRPALPFAGRPDPRRPRLQAGSPGDRAAASSRRTRCTSASARRSECHGHDRRKTASTAYGRWKLRRVADRYRARGCLPAVGARLRHARRCIDRVLAVVDGAPITLSDVNAAVRLGLVAAPHGAGDAARRRRSMR